MLEITTLKGRHVLLEPLRLSHAGELARFAFNPEIWRWNLQPLENGDDLHRYIENALADKDVGQAFPFVIRLQDDDRSLVGCTRYGNIDLDNKRLEIGWTWIDPEWQRTFVNTDTKLTLLTHAFETLQLNRVELKTDAMNERSRNAMLRIGAKEEGMLRRHMLTASGRVRDTVYFSIIAEEWPQVREGLLAKLSGL